jgi:hypothetical protein
MTVLFLQECGDGDGDGGDGGYDDIEEEYGPEPTTRAVARQVGPKDSSPEEDAL